jgi:hypothetical protein
MLGFLQKPIWTSGLALAPKDAVDTVNYDHDTLCHATKTRILLCIHSTIGCQQPPKVVGSLLTCLLAPEVLGMKDMDRGWPSCLINVSFLSTSSSFFFSDWRLKSPVFKCGLNIERWV